MSHATLSPSSAHRWRACPGSVNLVSRLIEQGMIQPDNGPGSEHAELGTHAHALLEYCVENTVEPNSQIGAWHHDRDVTPETAMHVSVAYDYVKGYQAKGATVYAERQVGPGAIGRDDIYGTADVCVLHPQGVLEVIDYKHGSGHVVEVEGNSQLQIYLLEALAEIDGASAEQGGFTTIIQPRGHHAKGPIRTVGYTGETLAELRDQIKADADATDDPAAPCMPGDNQCRWCLAKPYCGALAQHGLSQATRVFQPIEQALQAPPEFGKPAALSPEDLSQILENEAIIRTWLNAVHDYVHDELEAGRGFPGWKLVAGRKRRTWDFENEAATIDFLRERKQSDGKRKLGYDNCSKKVPLSPAQAEKSIKALVSDRVWNTISKHIITSEGKPVLAMATDPRPDLNVKAEDVLSPVVPDFLT